MRRCQANLPNRCRRQIDRIAHRALDGGQLMDREVRAAMTRKTYRGNLLWQSSLTLLAPKQNYKDIVKALMREIYPEFDFNEMQKQLTVSNKEDDNLVKNEILPELDKCYEDSRK